MDRLDLGIRLQNWHSSMSDPIYAVGSFYFANRKYPKKDIVEGCISNLKRELYIREKMLAGETVKTDKTNDLRAFAGYTDNELVEDISDLSQIILGVEHFLAKDY